MSLYVPRFKFPYKLPYEYGFGSILISQGLITDFFLEKGKGGYQKTL